MVPPRTLGQKVRESLLAIKVEREFTKDEILAKYLNTVYFGRGAYGVQAAAQTFFQKDASELSALESALLAGMVQSPSFYDPVEHEPEATERRNYVLEQMASEGYLTAERAAQLEGRPIKVDPIEVGLNFPGKLGYFLDYTRRDLISTVRRGPGVRRRAAGHDHARSADAALRRGGRRQPAAHARRSRGGGRRDRPPQRRRPRDVRGEELRGLEGEPRDRRRRFGAAGGVGVQAVHARHRDGAGLLAERRAGTARPRSRSRTPRATRTAPPGSSRTRPTRRAATSRCCRRRRSP